MTQRNLLDAYNVHQGGRRVRLLGHMAVQISFPLPQPCRTHLPHKYRICEATTPPSKSQHCVPSTPPTHVSSHQGSSQRATITITSHSVTLLAADGHKLLSVSQSHIGLICSEVTRRVMCETE